MAPMASKKRVSKKKKIAWRKHCDTKDIDNFLDDKRLEERLGFTFSEKPDEELFCIDKDLTNNEDVYSKTKEYSTGEVDKKGRPVKPARCFQILIPQSAVLDPIVKRNRVRTAEERRDPLIKKIEADRRKCGILKSKEISAIRNRAVDAERRKNRPKRGDFSTDLWADEVENSALGGGGDAEWLNPNTVQHMLKNTGRLKKRVPKSVHRKTSVVPAVEVPHPGMSYNPSFLEHQRLLKQVAEKEVELIKEEQHLERVTTKMFRKVSQVQKEQAWMSEMSEGLPTSTPQDEEPGGENDGDDEYSTVNPPVKNKKKTVQQRKKLKAARREQFERKVKKTEKKKVADIYKLKVMERSFEAREQKLSKIRAKKEHAQSLRANETKKLSKVKFEPPELEFNMPKDLRGNLRCVKLEGNLLNDRFKSLQRRNIVEPSVKQISKKAKRKTFRKFSHRMSWEL